MKLSELEAPVIRGGRCKEHPDNKQQGVCPSCLRDKLSKLYNSKLDKQTYYSPPCSPSHEISNSSASLDYVSTAYWRHHRRHASYTNDSLSTMMGFSNGLNKSKSVAFVSRNRPTEREDLRENRRRKKGSFWSKLLKLTTKEKNEAARLSSTMRWPKD